jgi:hypothetical protein
MPFKKYQSFADGLAQKKDLARGDVDSGGRQSTPRNGTTHAFSRAVAGLRDCRLLETTTKRFPISSMPMLGAGALDAKFVFSQYCE